jgi:predicted transcriptional regulator
MKKTQSIAFESELLEKLRKYAKDNYTTVSAVVRQAVSEKLEREQQKK